LNEGGGFEKGEAKASLYLHPSLQLWGCFVIFVASLIMLG
jgi:hypothetical protein